MYLNNLALVFADLGRRTQAEPLLRRAITITETAYGRDHPTVATYRKNLNLLRSRLAQVRYTEPASPGALGNRTQPTRSVADEYETYVPATDPIPPRAARKRPTRRVVDEYEDYLPDTQLADDRPNAQPNAQPNARPNARPRRATALRRFLTRILPPDRGPTTPN
jgi:hypothetical protein